jgi:hypothetical protein
MRRILKKLLACKHSRVLPLEIPRRVLVARVASIPAQSLSPDRPLVLDRNSIGRVNVLYVSIALGPAATALPTFERSIADRRIHGLSLLYAVAGKDTA